MGKGKKLELAKVRVIQSPVLSSKNKKTIILIGLGSQGSENILNKSIKFI